MIQPLLPVEDQALAVGLGSAYSQLFMQAKNCADGCKKPVRSIIQLFLTWISFALYHQPLSFCAIKIKVMFIFLSTSIDLELSNTFFFALYHVDN